MNLRVLTPSQLNREVKNHLESGFGRVLLEGEISNLSKPASGHWYFSIKDDRAQIRCAMFRNRTLGCNPPTNGDLVRIDAAVSLYEARGEFQLIVNALEVAGDGQLQRQFEALKKRLDQAGLFATDDKLPIPKWPNSIAVITSPEGAALKDVKSVFGRRWPLIKLLICPVLVQGSQAAGQIIDALQKVDEARVADIILITRGGGSLEDLWAFNDERLVLAIHACNTPVVSAVGHEIDFTLCDFVADLRAPTPSAAAEMIAPDSEEIKHRLHQRRRQLQHQVRAALNSRSQSLDWLWRRFRAGHPKKQIALKGERLANQQRRLSLAWSNQHRDRDAVLQRLKSRLTKNLPMQRLENDQMRLIRCTDRLKQSIELSLSRHKASFALCQSLLFSFNPGSVLARGYSMTFAADGKLIRDVSQVEAGQQLRTRLAHGEIISVASDAAAKIEDRSE